MKRYVEIAVICLIYIWVIAVIAVPQDAPAAGKKSKTTAIKRRAVLQHPAKSSKSSPNSRTNKKRGRKAAPALPRVEIITDTILAPGVRLTNFLFGRQRHNVYAVEMSTDSPDVEIGVVKSLDAASGLERLGDMCRRMDSCYGRKIIAAVNANFWRAYRNLPIGPLVSDGEVVQMLPYKQWSSAFFDARGRMTIDHFTMSGLLRRRGVAPLPIAAVNYRRDSLGVCMYNRFSGSAIPAVSEASVAQAYEELRLNSLMLGDDSTEMELDVEMLKSEIVRTKLEADAEFNLVKAQARYSGKPMVNRPLRCVIDTVSAGKLTIPNSGCLLSFGLDIAAEDIPHTGDTITLVFSAAPYVNQPFEWAVSGTPRLVRNGVAKHEAAIEGVTSKRFIGKNLARTAIGTDKTRSKNYAVVVQANNDKGKGATLAQMAAVMKQVGAWNALNLDGGGSTRMIVGGRNVFNGDTVSAGRRVAASLAIFLKNKVNTETGSK